MEHLPNVDSVMPKMPSGADCRFDTECPIGFFCDANSGACLRAEDHPSSTTEYRSGFHWRRRARERAPPHSR
jgi:hypothetical protein